MKLFKTFRKSIIVIFSLIIIFFVYISCGTNDINKEKGLKNADGNVYAGSVVCAKCHSTIYKDFLSTAHFHTSSVPTEQNIKGDFLDGKNIFAYDYSTFILMENLNGKFFQTEYYNGKKFRSNQFYIVIGSGTRGQSYLYKSNSQLYQLPISYFTNSDSWANSPGFPFYEPSYSRLITSRCLECHSTFANMASISATDKNGNPQNMIFGVECESCHGAAEKHVQFQEQHPNFHQAKFIINPSGFTRQQKIEMCAYCHSNGQRLKSAKPFTFKPGDPLNNFLQADTLVDTSHIDVHGNQTGLLALSKCFKMSNLECTNCHNTHEQERGNLALFSQRCMNCHNQVHNNFCKLTSLPASQLKTNCIDCHMPAKQSKILTVNLNQSSRQTPVIIRSHFIAVYPEETKKVLQKYKHN